MHRTAIALLVSFAVLTGQSADTGSIFGGVTDTSGAAIPGAEVVARNRDTGTERRTKTTDSGDYVLSSLPVGPYTVTISKPDFKVHSHEGVLLQVDQRARIDAVLSVGALSERVVVTGEAPLIETSAATLKQVVDTKRMAELPLNGRNPLELMLLVPGVQPTSGGAINQVFTNPSQQFVSSSGGRGNTVVYNLDGGDNSDSYTNVANVYPNPDALQEFSFQNNNFSAEYGRRSGGVVNAITRSGTNGFHGSLFEFVRNQELNAINFFTPGRPDGLKRNQYGASLGGPIVRDKTFFFGAWQGTKIRQLPASSVVTVPTAAMRNGDFSQLRTGAGAPVTVRDPQTGQPFVGNQIPLNRFDPISTKLLSFIPTPADPTGVLRFPIANASDDDQITARIDHNLTGSDRLSGRLLYDKFIRGNSLLDGNILTASYTPRFTTHNFTLSNTHTFSPRLLGVFSFTFNRLWSGYDFGYPSTLSDFGAQLFDMSPNKSISMSVGGFFGIADIGAAILVRNNFQYQAAMTYVVGRHELKFGADILRQRFNIPIAAFQSNGNYGFANQTTGSNLTDFMLGLPSSFNQITPWAEALRSTGPGFYFQDNFKVSRRLTLNLGFRYEPLLPWIDVRNQATAKWVVGQQSQRAPNLPPNMLVAGDPGVPDSGYESSYKKFDPRLGFAYLLPNGKTSIRVGAGIFHELPNAVVNNRFAVSPPFAVRVDIQNPPSIGNPFTSANPNPFPTTLPPPASFRFPRPVLGVTYGDDFTNAYSEQWNLTVEHQVTANWLGRVSYLGARGVHLLTQLEINPGRFIPGASTLANINERRPYAPDYTSVQSLDSTGYSDYHALSFSVESRFTRGVSLLASYTFSKSTDLQSAVVAHGGSLTNPYDAAYDHGLSDFDHTHRFVGSYLWELPTFSQSHRSVRLALGGWQANGIVTLQSGTPFSIAAGSDRSLDGIGGDRPNVVGDQALDTNRSKGERIARYFNTGAFQLNDFGTFGTSGRNIVRGPGLANVDASIFKNFLFTERVRLQFRTEVFNLFNRTNLNNPNTNMVSNLFGQITSAGPPRILQLALRFSF